MKNIFALIVLAGCSATAQPPDDSAFGLGFRTMPKEDTCNAAQFAPLIGQDATALEKTLYLGMVRVIRDPHLARKEPLPGRINFMIDKNETIEAITCG